MPTNEYGQPTDSKGNVKTQSQVIEAELDSILYNYESEIMNAMERMYKGKDSGVELGRNNQEISERYKKAVAALVLKHRHDVYFAAYRDGLAQGRQEANAIITSAKDVPPM